MFFGYVSSFFFVLLLLSYISICEWFVMYLVGFDASLLLDFRFVILLVFRVLIVLSFVFDFRVFLVLLETLLFPHTRVCGLCRGGCSNVFGFMFFCWGRLLSFSFLSISMMRAIN